MSAGSQKMQADIEKIAAELRAAIDVMPPPDIWIISDTATDAYPPENIRALLDELSRLREERDKYKTALTLTPMAERLAELPDFMVALSEWGCEDPNEQAKAITDFLNSLVGLKQYLDTPEVRALSEREGQDG